MPIYLFIVISMNKKNLIQVAEGLKDWLLSIYLYHKGSVTLPVFVVQEVNFVLLDSIRDIFTRKNFIVLTQDDISQWNDVFCLKLLDIKNHSELFYGKDILWSFTFKTSDLRSSLELEIRNKRIQLREDYLSHHCGKDFLIHLLPGMKILWEGGLLLKNPSIKLPVDMKELLSLFDIAWSCNSQIFYYLLDEKVDVAKIPSIVHEVHEYLSVLCTKVNNFK